MIKGKVEPVTEGVTIKIINNKTGEEVAVVQTDAAGQYKVGSLYDDLVYSVEAAKEDYIFKKETNTTFKAHKLSSVVVTVHDQGGKPLHNVFLQFSQGKNFRLSGSTNATGHYKFTALNSGKFYVSAILKEYEFNSSQSTIELKNGEHLHKTLTAKRVAFSAYGSVTKLNGWPMEQARVVARSSGSGEEQRVEEAVVDQDGLFRIRGLTPGLKYVLTVESEQVKRSVPNTITIDVKQQDTKGHDFIALMQSSYIELSGSVDFEGEDPAVIFKEDPKAIVELYDAKNMELPIQSWPLSLSRYF
jgi:hypothetical protein